MGFAILVYKNPQKRGDRRRGGSSLCETKPSKERKKVGGERGMLSLCDRTHKRKDRRRGGSAVFL